MEDRRIEIFKTELYKHYRPSFQTEERTNEVVKRAIGLNEEVGAILNAMDEYMRETCLELLEYVAKNKIQLDIVKGEVQCYLNNGEGISKEQLFENFL